MQDDPIIIDRDPQDVNALKSLFQADQSGTSWESSSWKNEAGLIGSHLVISPVNSETTLLDLIHHAQSSIHIEIEELASTGFIGFGPGYHKIIDALTAAADPADSTKKPVDVKVIVPQGATNPISDSKVQVVHGIDLLLYMHAKVIIVDGTTAFIGSQNLTSASLNWNREIGILITAEQYPEVLSRLNQTFADDWKSLTSQA